MSIVVYRLHLQNNGMRGNRSAGKGRMSSATSMYRMSLVNRSWFSNVTPWDSSRAVGMEEASLGMSEISRVGTHDRASGLSGVSCTKHKRQHALLQLQPVSLDQDQHVRGCISNVLEIARTLCCSRQTPRGPQAISTAHNPFKKKKKLLRPQLSFRTC